MIEVMIPNFEIEGEFWTLRQSEKLSDCPNNIRYCDGSISNIIFDIKDVDASIDKILGKLFEIYDWVNKVILKHDKDLLANAQRK